MEASIASFDAVDHRWFKIIAIVLGIAIAVLAGFSISAFWAVRQGETISPTQANALWIGNIVLLIIAIGIILWALITIFFHREIPAGLAPAPPTVAALPTQAQITDYLSEEIAETPLSVPVQPYTASYVRTSTSGAGSNISAAGLQRLQYAASV